MSAKLPAGVGATFWATGNLPNQLVSRLTAGAVIYHLKLLYLLSDKILAAASFYFESESTRAATHTLSRLFEEGDILYFIADDLNDFSEHGASKIKKSPKGFSAYSNPKAVATRAKELSAITSPTKRPPISISDKIVELWIADLHSTDDESLGGRLGGLFKESDWKLAIINKLSHFAKARKLDFVWEYLQPELKRLHLPSEFQVVCRRRLAQFYCIATCQLLGVGIDNNDLKSTARLVTASRFDTALFDECMRVLNVDQAIARMPDIELMMLKRSPEFQLFRELYFKLIESVSYNASAARRVLPLLVKAEAAMVDQQVNVGRFLEAFRKMCRNLRIPRRHYARPLDLLLSTYDSFSKATVAPFITTINAINATPPNAAVSLSVPRIAEEFVQDRIEIVKGIIVERWRIPATSLPGEYEQVLNRIVRWFKHFRPTEYELALQLLRAIDFYPQQEIDCLLDRLAEEIETMLGSRIENAVIFGLGTLGAESGEQFLYPLRKRLGISSEHFPRTWDGLPDEAETVFVDDFIGSGSQAVKFYQANAGSIGRSVHYCSLVGFRSGVERIRAAAGFRKVFTCKQLEDGDRAFSDTSGAFPDSRIRSQMRELCFKYGKALYPAWPLGYEGCEALVVFRHNTPNNTLPVIWASARNEKAVGVPWSPVWERIKYFRRPSE